MPQLPGDFPRGAMPGGHTDTPPRVLLAEDNPITQRLVVDYLQQKGFEISVAVDGHAALATVRRERPAVLLLDIQMPQLDGFAVLRAIRADDDPAVRAVRVIALTAMAMRGDEEQCIAAGADAYCAKPVRLRDLTALIETQVEAGRAGVRATEAAP